MGLNAQTAVPAFTAGQVLTAEEQTQINTGIPVFATTSIRDTAFGGAGEKTLAEGQFAYIEASDTTQYYDGSAWQTLAPTPGLRVVKAETAFTAAGTFTADTVFTSTYTNYLLIVNFTTVSGAATLQLRTGGTASATGYNYQSLSLAGATVTGALASSQTSFALGTVGNNVIIPIEIYGPQLAAPTSIYSKSHQNPAIANAWNYWGAHNVSTAYDGVQLSFTTGTGTYTIYGYSKS